VELIEHKDKVVLVVAQVGNSAKRQTGSSAPEPGERVVQGDLFGQDDE